MRECGEYEITVEKLLKICHGNERVAIHVISDFAMMEDRMKEFFITEDAFERPKGCSAPKEKDRLLKYYKDVPVWNLGVGYDNEYRSDTGLGLVLCLVARCHYADVREGYLREKEDIRKAKRRERTRRRKETNEEL